MWLLANEGGATTVRPLNLQTGLLGEATPVSNSTVAITESASGTLGLGLATTTTGALDLSSASSPQSVVSVPIGAPVRGVAAGESSFYVLDGNASSASVSIVNPQTGTVQTTLPAPSDAIGIAASGVGNALYVLEPSGRVVQIDETSGRVVDAFSTGSSARAMALSPDGSTLYVLKGTGVENIGVIDLATESQTKALPAAANSVDIQIGPDGSTLFSLVGTQASANVQVFSLGATNQ